MYYPYSIGTQPLDYNIYNSYNGYDMLSSINQDINNLFDQYQPIYQVKLKSKLSDEIMSKLETLKLLEAEIADSLVNAKVKNDLQRASRGAIDASRIPDAALPEILEKHSNLLNLSTKHNDKVKDITETLKKINDALIKKSIPMSMSLSYPLTNTQTQYTPNIPWGPLGPDSYPIYPPTIITPYTYF